MAHIRGIRSKIPFVTPFAQKRRTDAVNAAHVEFEVCALFEELAAILTHLRLAPSLEKSEGENR